MVEYENWKGKIRAERRETKKAKKMSVHGAGAFEVWKVKMEKAEKQAKKSKRKNHNRKR